MNVRLEAPMAQHVDAFLESVLVEQVAHDDDQSRAWGSIDKAADDARQIGLAARNLQLFQEPEDERIRSLPRVNCIEPTMSLA